MKNFDEWNVKKKILDIAERNILSFYEREIWWCSVGVNIGCESDGKGVDFMRPVLVLEKLNNDMFLGVSITSKIGFEKRFFHELQKNQNSFIQLSQLRVFDAKRLHRIFGRVSRSEFVQIKDEIKNILFPD
ncbi:MAG: type II toxin-antitoxin system PemK/MazF family toxin [bacterium]